MRTTRSRRIAAVVYAVVSAGVIGFQFALAVGAPWGAYAMGAAFPGRFPMELRVAAAVQALVLTGMAAAVLSRAGLLMPGWPPARGLAWVVVGVAAISLVLNLITPSAGERAIWAPVALLLLISSLVVATGR
jgi:hypothetical protein